MAAVLPPLLGLPLELREHIFSYYFDPASHFTNEAEWDHNGEPSGRAGGGMYDFDMRLMRVNRQIYHEARSAWKRCGTFVVLRTPWPTAVHHISTEGFVPIVSAGPRAAHFKDYSFEIEITAPRYDAGPDHSLVLLLDDNESFAQTWYYSQLSYPVLNTELHVHFIASPAGGWEEDPHQDTGEKGETTVPLPLQRKFLLPFTCIKSLRSSAFTNLSPAIVSALKEGMAEPVVSLQSSLENCVALTVSGDELLNSTPPQPLAALDAYQKAFHAIHVLIKGRTRHVLAEAFFGEEVPGGQFAGQSGSAIRIILRIRLVSRHVLAYLRLHQYEEAAFWGLRSIRIMREAMSENFEDFMTAFSVMGDVGPLYTRTAIALQLMEEREPEKAARSSPASHNGSDSPAVPRQYFTEDFGPYGSDDLESSRVVWGYARHYIGNQGEEVRKIVKREVEEFGIVAPISLDDDAATATTEGEERGESSEQVSDGGLGTDEEEEHVVLQFSNM